jgi:hydroxyquinol 1,2-dioxygenase
MNNIDHWTITGAVLRAHAQAKNPRLREIMDSLVRHLHGFARDVRLTELEWANGIKFLTRVGRLADDKQQGFVLLSDVLGLSTLVALQDDSKSTRAATEFTPLEVADVPGYSNDDDVSNGAEGEPCFVSGVIRGIDGETVPNARIDFWQLDERRPDGIQRLNARGWLCSLDDGHFRFRSILPVPYPIPSEEPVGQLLGRLGRYPCRPAHLHFAIAARGYKTLATQVFRRGDEYLECDPVLGDRPLLVAKWTRHDEGIAPDGTVMTSPFSTLQYEFVLNPAAWGA